jgi:hypothetical protein
MSDKEPDGFVIVHTPADGTPSYGIGPFPPIDGLPERIIADLTCGCEMMTLWVAFPRGLRMMFDGRGAADDPQVVAIIRSMVGDGVPVYVTSDEDDDKPLVN